MKEEDERNTPAMKSSQDDTTSSASETANPETESDSPTTAEPQDASPGKDYKNFYSNVESVFKQFQGQLPNQPPVIINIIQGDHATVAQGRTVSGVAGSSCASANSTLHPDEKQPENPLELEEYINRNIEQESCYCFLCILLLDIVEEGCLDSLAAQLKKILLGSGQALPEHSEPKTAVPLSLSQIFNRTFSESCICTINSNAGPMEVPCVRFSDSVFSETAYRWFFLIYPQFRVPITEWLVKLTAHSSPLIRICSEKGLLRYASLDYQHAHQSIIPKFSKELTFSNVRFLSELFQQMLKNEATSKNAQAILHNWITQKNSDLWQVCEAVFSSGNAPSLEEDINTFLSNLFYGRFIDYETDAERITEAFLYLLYYARTSEHLLLLIFQTLGRMFTESLTSAKKLKTADLFLSLLLSDLVLVDKSRPEMIFLHAFRKKASRMELLPLFLYCRSIPSLAESLTWTLEQYFNDAVEHHSDLSELVPFPFWKWMAFTGKESDYQRTVHYLSVLDRRHGKTTTFFRDAKNELEEILQHQLTGGR